MYSSTYSPDISNTLVPIHERYTLHPRGILGGNKLHYSIVLEFVVPDCEAVKYSTTYWTKTFIPIRWIFLRSNAYVIFVIH